MYLRVILLCGHSLVDVGHTLGGEHLHALEVVHRAEEFHLTDTDGSRCGIHIFSFVENGDCQVATFYTAIGLTPFYQ